MKGKPLVLEFFDYTVKPSCDSSFLKFVLFRIDGPKGLIGFDYGFANYIDGKFETLEDNIQMTKAWVVKWAEVPNPKLLL